MENKFEASRTIGELFHSFPEERKAFLFSKSHSWTRVSYRFGRDFLFTQLYHFIILLFSQTGPMRLSKLQLNSTVLFFKITNSPLAESALNTGLISLGSHFLQVLITFFVAPWFFKNLKIHILSTFWSSQQQSWFKWPSRISLSFSKT